MPPSDNPITSGSGEKPAHREAMEQLRATLIQNGNTPAYAERKAREAAIRHDRNNR